LLVMVRVHPYESIGSYMMQGMLQWLNDGGDEAKAFLSSHRFAFLPMPNPDGVAEGNCKRTAGGLDLNEAATSDEPEGVALAAYFRGVNPQATFDIHGFMHQNDGFGTSDITRGEAIRDRLRPLPQWEGKKLNCSESRETEGGAGNLGQMIQTESGSVRFGGSWSWYNRDARCLREMGVELLKAYAAQFVTR
ncbi:M14 family zinc carboxypeptidase, partial [Planctomycetota bacterium]